MFQWAVLRRSRPAPAFADLVHIKDVRIASPCTSDWAQMTGTDRVRHCRECNLRVYDFSAMTVSEIEGLLSRGGSVCARIYRRADGTMLTEDCPVGVRARVVRRVSRAAGMAVAALMSISAAAWQKVQPKECSVPAQAARHDSGMEVTVVDPQEALVPRAQVVIARKDGRKKKGTTDGEGRLRFENLKAGDYVLSVNAKGFRIASSSVSLNEARVLEVKVRLKVGEAASETIVVAEASMVVGTTIDIRDGANTSSVPQVPGGQRAPVPLRQ